jgi:hypothetical protein
VRGNWVNQKQINSINLILLLTIVLKTTYNASLYWLIQFYWLSQ